MLVNPVTHLKGQAFSFYRSCDATQHTQYPILVAEVITLVCIQSVQNGLFHDRKQKSRRECGHVCA